MYFKNDREHTSILEIDGFKFRKIVIKEDSRVTGINFNLIITN